MSIQRIYPPAMRKSAGLTQVVRVDDTVYISGQVALDENGVIGVGDIEAQVNHVYGSLEAGLKSQGGDLNNLVKITAFTTRPEYYRAVVDARKRFLGPKPAASTTVIVPSLARPNLLVEIEAIAVVGAAGATKESIDPPGLPKPEHHAMLVKVGNVVYICGMVGWDRDGNVVGINDPAAQVAQLYSNIDTCLKAVGATRDDVVKTTTFFTHPFYYEELRKAWEAFYGSKAPSSAAIIVSHLASPDAVYEIEAIAVIGEEKRRVNPDTIYKPSGFSQIVQVGNTAYIAGVVGLDPQRRLMGKGDPDAQLNQLYANLGAALGAIGGDRLNMVKTTTFCTHPDYFASVRRAREEFYGDAPPASTAVHVAGLVGPDYLVEIEAIAAVG